MNTGEEYYLTSKLRLGFTQVNNPVLLRQPNIESTSTKAFPTRSASSSVIPEVKGGQI